MLNLNKSGEIAAHLHRVEAKLFIISLEIYTKVKNGMDMLDLDIPIVCVSQDFTAKLPPAALDFKHFMSTDGITEI